MAGPKRTQVAQPHVAAPVLTGVVALALLELITRSGAVPDRFLPAPSAVLVRIGRELAEGNLVGHAASTLLESLAGCLIGFVVALPLGYLVSHFRAFSAAVSPYLVASQAIPAVAVAPLLVLWFGYGLFPVALLCALLVFFPIYMNTAYGFRALPEQIIGAARVDGASRAQLLVHIEGPLALPAILTGVRNGFVLSVTGAVVGEFVMGGEGLGVLLSVYRDRSDVTGLFAVLAALAGLAVSIFLLVRLLERKFRWW